MVFRFRKFKIYQEAKKLHIEIIKITRKIPRDYEYISNQIRRSSLSPILNIAEGSAKRLDKDFNRYLENAMGSVNETMAILEILLELGFFTLKEFEKFEQSYGDLVNQLGGFSKKLISCLNASIKPLLAN